MPMVVIHPNPNIGYNYYSILVKKYTSFSCYTHQLNACYVFDIVFLLYIVLLYTFYYRKYRQAFLTTHVYIRYIKISAHTISSPTCF